jgi:hypothetical protein
MLYTEPSIGASHQVSVHLAKQFQRRRFLEINQPETRIPMAAMFVNRSIFGISCRSVTLHSQIMLVE